MKHALHAALALAVLSLALLAAGSARAADPAKGRKLYAANCALCHGPEGRAVMPGAPSFGNGAAPGALMRPDMVLLGAIRAGKNAMPAFQGRLADRDIMDVIAFMRTLH